MDEPVRILIAEDLPTDTELAQREIRKVLPSCVFAQVDTREDYLAALESFQPDLIVSDYHMPRFDGMTALQLALDRAPLTPLIIWTGSLNEDIAVDCMKAGASNYVIKEHMKRLGTAVVHALAERQVRQERRRAEHALREREEMYRSLVSASPSAITVTDLQGRVLMVNHQALDTYGYTDDSDVLGCSVFGWVPPEEIDLAKRDFDALLAKGVLMHQERIRVRHTGERFFAEINAAVANDASGQPQFVIFLTTDIGERKLAEERIRAQAARAETLVRTAARLNATLDLDAALKAVCEEIAAALNTPLVNIFLYDEKSDMLSSALVFGMSERPEFHSPIPRQMLDSQSQEGTLSIFAIPNLTQKTAMPQAHLHAQAGVLSVTTALMKHHDRVVGAISITSPGKERILTADEQALFKGLADQAAMAVSNARLFTQQKLAEEALRESEARYRARTEELETLFTLSSRLREAASADGMLQIVLQEMRRVLNADACEILLPDATGESLVVAHSDGDIASDIVSPLGREEGCAGWVMRNCQTYVAEDYATDPDRMTSRPHADQVGPAALAPLQSENRALGILTATRRRSQPSRPFSQEEVRLLTAIGEMAGNALRRVRLFDDVQRHLSRTQSLHEIQLTVTSSFDLSKTLTVALEHAVSQLGVDAAAVFLFDPQTNTLEWAGGQGFKTDLLQRTRLRLGEGFAGRTVLEKRMSYVPDLSRTAGKYLDYPLMACEGFVGYCGVPLIAKGQIKGVLEIFHRTPLTLDREQLAFLETLAGQAAIGIDNLTLFTDLHHSHLQLAAAYDATIEGLSRALDLRDKETEGHTQRVVDLTLRLARKLGMREAELVHVRRGALLHDIGKIGIPDAILLKPAALDEDEWTVMRRHPQYGFDMLSAIDYLRPALDIPHYHHERWDGLGYPNALKGEEIPLAARLFAVVDVWDALTNERQYRAAWSSEQALAYIRDQAGKQFDPNIAQIFLDIIAERHA